MISPTSTLFAAGAVKSRLTRSANTTRCGPATPGGGDLSFFGVATQTKLLHDPGDALMVDRPVVVVGGVMRQLCRDAFSTVEQVFFIEDRLELRP